MQSRDKYFYTILFLDDYFPAMPKNWKEFEYQVELPKLRSFEISADTNTTDVKWIDGNTLYVRHGLTLPLTLEMWNAEGKPIFYVPLLKEGIDSISVGQVVIESTHTIHLIFNEDNPPPAQGETYKLSLKTLPQFDTTSNRLVNKNDVAKTDKAFDELIDVNKTGMAIVFRRNSMDAHFDLEVEFDEMYLHSLSDAHDIRYLTDKSKFQRAKWLTMYTDNLQDVVEQINTNIYEVKFSWAPGSQCVDDPFGYQIQRGHHGPAWIPGCPFKRPW